MDALKKVLHPHSSSTTDKTTHHDSTNLPQDQSSHTHPNEATLNALGNEPNVTGTNRPPPTEDFSSAQGITENEHPQPRRGHHHPRQPVGATGLPPNHHPREDFTGGDTQGAASSGDGRQELVEMGKLVAESGNNFPGTNPHPAHSALGNQTMTGQKGTVMPGRE